MSSLNEEIRAEVRAAVLEVLEPFLPKLSRPDARSYTYLEAGLVIGCSDRHVSKLVERGVLPVVPHMGAKKRIPRTAVEAFVDGVGAPASHPGDAGAGAPPTPLEAAS